MGVNEAGCDPTEYNLSSLYFLPPSLSLRPTSRPARDGSFSDRYKLILEEHPRSVLCIRAGSEWWVSSLGLADYWHGDNSGEFPLLVRRLRTIPRSPECCIS
jgi:hypothetical protein